MGREATCTCVWNGEKSNVKALIEPPELILRGELRRRIPIAKMSAVKAERGQLRFSIDGESVALSLGNTMAANWADVLLKPPPSLAKKLGITQDTKVWMIGPVDDAALKAALSEGKAVSHRTGGLILARVDTLADLHSALMRAADQLRRGHADLVHLPEGPRASSQRKSCPHYGAGHWHCRHEGGVCFYRFLRTAFRETTELRTRATTVALNTDRISDFSLLSS